MLQDASGFRQLSVNENHLDASPSRQASVFSNIVEIDERFSQSRVMPLERSEGRGLGYRYPWLVLLRHKARRMFRLNCLAQHGHLGSAVAIATIIC
jgi:hypothetical protein